ncbi:MAG: AbrB/MazE/SpoVT family DNA-binding domain-containing protein [Polyangiaceae bacterium]
MSARGVARVFWSGRSQAIRLPKEFRVDERDLLISRRGKKLVLEPRSESVDENGWPKSFWKLFGALPKDFDVGSRDLPAERGSPLEDDE